MRENMKLKKRTSRMLALLAPAWVVVAIAATLCGCSREEPAAPEAESLPPRLEDPEYRATLKQQETKQRDIMMEKVRIDGELAEALKDDPEGAGERVQSLRKEQEEIYKRFKESREEAAAIVRARILQDNAKNNLNEKGTR